MTEIPTEVIERVPDLSVRIADYDSIESVLGHLSAEASKAECEIAFFQVNISGNRIQYFPNDSYIKNVREEGDASQIFAGAGTESIFISMLESLLSQITDADKTTMEIFFESSVDNGEQESGQPLDSAT